MASRTRPERAALAFSALSAGQATEISRRFSIVERSRLRESLSAVRNAPDSERREALEALVAAVKAPMVFPAPAAHDEETCVFRTLERYMPEHLAGVLERLARVDKVIVAVALCHFDDDYREQVWACLPPATRASMRGVLGQVPLINHARTRRYAQELASRCSTYRTAR